MGSFFADILAEILEWYLDIKFWFKKRKRRKFEKENNLPKKVMIYPSDKIVIASVILSAIAILGFGFFIHPTMNNISTEDKLAEISTILEDEKEALGAYPNTLKAIIRNNPLRKNLVIDAWDNDIQYQLSNDGKTYNLFSVGNDREPNTKDDIVFKK
jgi:hypothetical protein